MEDQDLSLKSRRLPAEVIISNFVKGDEVEYETYLIEFLNQSKWFQNRFNTPFIKTQTESNGECDCYAGSYGLDFKLIASQSELRATSCMSAGKVVFASGLRATVQSKEQGSMQAFCLYKLLRFCSIEDLKRISKATNVKKDEKDIKAFLKLLKKKKNLFLFHPYVMLFANVYTKEEGARQITNAINRDFSSSMQFRNENCSLDTYLAFVHLDYLVITKYGQTGFEVIDFVELNVSPTFQKLWNYSW